MAARKGVLDKTQALRIHAKRQALLRYNVAFSSEDLAHLANVIRRGSAQFVARKSLRVSCWRVAHEGREMVVLYDKQRRAIVTFLPADCWEVRSAESSMMPSSNTAFQSFETPSRGAQRVQENSLPVP